MSSFLLPLFAERKGGGLNTCFTKSEKTSYTIHIFKLNDIQLAISLHDCSGKCRFYRHYLEKYRYDSELIDIPTNISKLKKINAYWIYFALFSDEGRAAEGPGSNRKPQRGKDGEHHHRNLRQQRPRYRIQIWMPHHILNHFLGFGRIWFFLSDGGYPAW